MRKRGGRRDEDQNLLHNPKILGVLASLILTAFFGVAVDQGVERDPYHSHIVVGGTPEEQARTLADHLHGHLWGWGREADKAADATTPRGGRMCGGKTYDDAGRGPRVLSFRSHEASVIGLGGGTILAASWLLLSDERPVARIASPFGGTLSDTILPVPTPPPKLA